VVRANLLIVVVFAVVAVVLLARATVATVGIHDDLVHATPPFDDTPKDTLALPQLDRTATLIDGLAAGVAPFAAKVHGIAGDAKTMAAATHQVRTHLAAVDTAADTIASSTTTMRISTADLAAVVADLAKQVGDISTAFATAGTAVGTTTASVVTMTGQAAAAATTVKNIQSDLARVRRTLPQIARHTENIESAKALHDTEHARKQRTGTAR
jgi:methyl-accepting chemotaxis protein